MEKNDYETKRLKTLERQVERLQRHINTYQSLSNRWSNIRLGVISLGVIIAFGFGLQGETFLFWLMLAITFALFGVAVWINNRIRTALDTHQRWQVIKKRHVARMTLDFENIPPLPPSDAQNRHPFELDLDLDQLFRLINTTVSYEGAALLKAWLLNLEPNRAEIEARQDLIQALKPLTRFRDHLEMVGSQLGGRRWRGEALVTWLNASPQQNVSLRLVIGLGGWALINATLFLGFAAGILPPLWLVTWLGYMGVVMYKGQNLFGEGTPLLEVLRGLNRVFVSIERYNYENKPQLKALCHPILEDRPSASLKQLEWTVGAAGVQLNGVVWFILNAIMPWDAYHAYQLARQREHLRMVLPQWLAVWYKLEALMALANFAYLHPCYIVPSLTDSPNYEGDQIGHPLILPSAKVCNDFALNDLGSVVIITGSNMAGKSSFLRTLGLNLCLAYAGTVVNANSLTLGMFRLFSCIRVTDSLSDGISYFYAEVRRLRALLDALETDQEQPLFFLIDEIFRGTNNRERLIGSRAYIQRIAQGQGMGLIATHDLELTQLATDAPNIQNYHFRETIEDGQMVFDYTLRQGPCPTTNALKIMALEGLPTDV